MQQIPASFYEQNYVWQVYFDTSTSFTQIILTYNRLLSEDRFIQFDEDQNSILVTEQAEDEQFLLDAFFTLIPENERLSCAMNATKHVFLWEKAYHQYIFAGYNREKVLSEFKGRLWNPDSSPDYLFVGGDESSHTGEAIEQWTRVMSAEVLPQTHQAWEQILGEILTLYERIIYTRSTQIHMLMFADAEQIAAIRARLSTVAAQYGLVLPPE